MGRYTLTFSDEEERIAFKDMRSWERPSTYLKHYILEAKSTNCANCAACANGAESTDRATPSPARAPASLQEEKKEEEEKNKKKGSARLAPLPIAEKVIGHLNQQAGTAYRPGGQSARRLIAARMRDGYTVADLLRVIDVKCTEWCGGEMAKYLRPSTLFGAEKFEQYHGQAATAKVTPEDRLAAQAERQRRAEEMARESARRHRPAPEPAPSNASPRTMALVNAARESLEDRE
jgi:uncharacterized phage protein (TIGR02220 family)